MDGKISVLVISMATTKVPSKYVTPSQHGTVSGLTYRQWALHTAEPQYFFLVQPLECCSASERSVLPREGILQQSPQCCTFWWVESWSWIRASDQGQLVASWLTYILWLQRSCFDSGGDLLLHVLPPLSFLSFPGTSVLSTQIVVRFLKVPLQE